MVELRDRRLILEGKPRLVFAGEVHYFRLARKDWEDRVAKAKAMGCNAIASYIPWVVHQPQRGAFDLDGRTKPENDLGAFIDLCHRHGLWFIARPGPFIMAEMKNEGIPYWVYRDCPGAIPQGWGGEAAKSKTLDYLEPAYLKACQDWYAQVMPVLASRLVNRGGPVMAVQLDNEIGMLSWVNNQPDLTESSLCGFARWLGEAYPDEVLGKRYPFDIHDPAPRNQALRSPDASYAMALHRDLSAYNRDRFARYVAELRKAAESNGVSGVPFLVNLHGTGGGRAHTFPIGIQQLYKSYAQAPGYWAGSDHYLGELDRENAPDLYMLNAFMDSVNRPEQPLSSLEFEVGTGDYGETKAVRQSAASADFKVRLSIAQGNRLLNYYLLAGGINPPLEEAKGDGNGRIAFTGERHGFAAPISPEGDLDPTYYGLQRTTRAMLALEPWLADAEEERDDLALGFHPDYYTTDLRIPGPVDDELIASLEYVRGPLDVLCRALTFLGFRFTGVDLLAGDLRRYGRIAFSCSRYLDEATQQRLADYARNGGQLSLFGEFPILDLEGKPCRALADAVGIQDVTYREASGKYHLSVQPEGRLADQPEVRVWRAAAYRSDSVTPLFRLVETGEVCGFEAKVGKGAVRTLSCNYPCHLPAFRALVGDPGLPYEERDKPALPRPFGAPNSGGILHTTTRTPKGDRFLTVLNLDSYARRIAYPGLLEDEIVLGPRSARLLPLQLDLGWVRLQGSTLEVESIGEREVRFRAENHAGKVEVRGDARAIGGTLRREGDRLFAVSKPGQSLVLRRR